MVNVAEYLRKSRADIEAEARGEGETLAKHKKALHKLAHEKGLNIVKIYEEIVSGETIIHRPQMLKLLDDVSNGKYDAVLCMDIDRLGRGNMQEQGLILETFKASNTKIITPRKTYDLNNEWDEEYSEFETFMARRELKIITRRMQSGRVRSVEEGNYIATNPPFGYIIKELDNGRTLEPHPEQADVVRMIFEWYTHEDADKRIGTNLISNKLNSMGYKTYTGRTWNSSSVLNIIKNAVYAGRIQWGRKEIKKSTDPGKVKDTKTRPRNEWIDVKGKHEPLISMKTYQTAQDILKTKYHVPYQLTNGVRNPLAGIVKCGFCSGSMVYRPYIKQKPHIKCNNQPKCRCKASNFELVEQRLISGLREWLDTYKAQWENHRQPENEAEIDEVAVQLKSIASLQKELNQLEVQKGNLHDLLERGIYSEEIFLERSNDLANRVNKIQTSIEKIGLEIEYEKDRKKAQKEIIPKVERVLDLYKKTDDPKKKNALLKSVLEKAVYKKEKWQFRDEFALVLYPKVPHHYLRQITS